MATGLLARDAGGGAAMPAGNPQGAPAPEMEDGGGQPNVSPEEQAQYEAFVNAALTLISDDNTEAGLLKSLGGSKDPILSLASTAVNVVKRVEAAAAKKNQQIPGEIILHGGQEIVEALAAMAAAAGIHDYTPEEVEGAFYRAADMYREDKAAAGEIDEAAAKSDIEELKAADQAGDPMLKQAAAALGGQMKGAQ